MDFDFLADPRAEFRCRTYLESRTGKRFKGTSFFSRRRSGELLDKLDRSPDCHDDFDVLAEATFIGFRMVTPDKAPQATAAAPRSLRDPDVVYRELFYVAVPAWLRSSRWATRHTCKRHSQARRLRI